MCTAISFNQNGHFFGRTLDLEMSYDEKVVITPRSFCFNYLYEKELNSYAIIGTAHIENGVPLYYDAANEKGLAIAGLNFPKFASYSLFKENKCNIASFEFIPFILRSCASTNEAISVLNNICITNDSFSDNLKATPLHWIISDKDLTITVESTVEGVKIHENPFGVLTNSPDFKFQCLNLSNYYKLSPNSSLINENLIEYSRGLGAFGLPGDFSSTSRFVRAVYGKSHTICNSGSLNSITKLFHILDLVFVPCGCTITNNDMAVSTIYSSCIDTSELCYYFTTYNNRRIRCVKMKEFDISSKSIIAFSMNSNEDILVLS